MKLALITALALPTICLAQEYSNLKQEALEVDPNFVTYNWCRKQPDGTQFPDPNNAQGYIECIDGQGYPQDCDDDLYWDLNLHKCDIYKACYPPTYFPYYDYGYQDGIYYLTDVTIKNATEFNVFQSRLLCEILGAKLAMPKNEKEYSYMLEIQDRNLQRYRKFYPWWQPQNADQGFDYEFFVGIEDIWRSNDTTWTNATYYYYEDSRRGGIDIFNYGEPFEHNDWWMEGYPNNVGTNKTQNFINKYETHVVQDNQNGLRNVPYFGTEYHADGINCMYICPGYQ